MTEFQKVGFILDQLSEGVKIKLRRMMQIDQYGGSSSDYDIRYLSIRDIQRYLEKLQPQIERDCSVIKSILSL